MNKNNVLTTIKKELRSIFRDKKALLMIFVVPIFIAFFIIFFSSLYSNIEDTETKEYEVGVNYTLSSTEKEFMKSLSLKPVAYQEEELAQAFASKEISAYLIYDRDNNKYTIYSDQGNSGLTTASLLMTYLDNYNRYLGDQYLLNEGMDPAVIYQNFTYEQEYISGENIMLDTFLSVAFAYIIMAIALTSSSMATTATAVEKEQGTLETILTFPITTTELISGKYLATVIMSTLSSLFGLLVTILSLIYCNNTYSIYKDINININLESILIAVIICLVASILISGIALAITSYTKTYKEAQAATQILSYITIAPMIFSMIETNVPNLIYYAIPILGHVQILMDIFSSTINYLNIIACIVSSLVLTYLVIVFIIKRFKSEKVLFGI